MRIRNCRLAVTGRALCFVASLTVFTSTSVLAQANSWINPSSGAWDDPSSWSLGALPESTDSVLITNSGWKAVAINPSTPINFPGSMTVSSLTIQGATNTQNTLLLNYFGTGVPLTVLNGLTLQNYTQLLNFNSGLAIPGGTLFVTNSQINQDGGFIVAANATLANSVYNLTNGDFEAGSVWLGWQVSAQYNQYGGTATISNLNMGAQYAGPIQNGIWLYGGTFKPGGLDVFGGPAGVTYFQAGGTNETGNITIEPAYGGASPSFTLNGGLLADNNVAILGGSPDILAQNGGSHVVTNSLSISGEMNVGAVEAPAMYYLNAGTLSANIIELDADNGNSFYAQTNGTASAQTIYAHSVGYYAENNTTVTLAGGTLSCSNYTTVDGGGQLNQTGGALVVSNLLSMTGSRQPGGPSYPTMYATYTFTGGTLSSSNINIGGIFTIADGLNNQISNPGFFTLSGLLNFGTDYEQLGQFILAGTNATIDLTGSACTLSFANSSSQTWTNGAVLNIDNWNGSLSGNGADRIYFGNDSTGLTSQQLSQIQFINPPGLPIGAYPARILSDGEVVPKSELSNPGLVNSWINPASGNWDDATSWSLGVLPASSQSVVITNAGFKAVAIESSTPINFPASMTVSNLTLTSPTNGQNTLLMNYVGAGSPLVVGLSSTTPGSLFVGTNSAIVMYSSGLIVNNVLETNNSRLGGFEVDGAFTQSDSAEVVAGFLDLNGTYNFTNGMLFVGNQFINGAFTQQGGSNYATSVTVRNGYYDFFDGLLSAGGLTLTNGASFTEYGGLNTNGGMILTGTTNYLQNPVTSIYTLQGGTLETPFINMFGSSFNHYAGTNIVGTLSISNAPGGYVLNSGLLRVDQIQVSGTSFSDNGGTLTGTLNLAIGNASWSESHASMQLGQLQLLNTNAYLYLVANPCVLQFADSSGVSWAGDGLLKIVDWAGSLSGGGSSQLIFGTSSSGLTAQQLSQVQFFDPAGLPSGIYSAQILSDGEVVPNQSISNSGTTNAWINPASGNWDNAASWSLGVLPASLQFVLITNSGSKAVAINPSTPINSPGSMTVSNLFIQGATNTVNTLLLNSFGTNVPLTVLNGLTLQNGAQILDFNSGLVVQGGLFTVTNSQINQDGGSIITTNAGLSLADSAYNLTNGDFEANEVSLGFMASAGINQYGGTVTIANLQFGATGMGSGGGYALYGGNLSLPGGITLNGQNNSYSTYFQSGGTNLTTEVSMEPGLFGISPNFTLNGGLLADNDVAIHADNFGSLGITQNGGTHVITNTLNMVGGPLSLTDSHSALYVMNGGTLSAASMSMDASEGVASFNQSAGIAQFGNIQGIPSQSPTFVASVNLSGGTLACWNLYMTDGATINQTGGTLIASNSLAFGGYIAPGPKIYSTYTLYGGTLIASNISVGGVWIIGDSPTNRISNSGTFSLSHTLQIGNATVQLGQFILADNATINLAGSTSQLSFANSSSQYWEITAMLTVTNWTGNPSGGGAQQLKFGIDQSGLTAAQLARIQFIIGTNLYSAKILNTGEVVPGQAIQTSLTYSQQGNHLVLSWPTGWTLQSAPNAAGPYSDVTTATSPYTINTTAQPQQFFRLRE